jgi:hypothetical protein
MPSGITHILLIHQFLNTIDEVEIRARLDAHLDLLSVGAVAPDLPYVSVVDFRIGNRTELADDFHYKNTNLLPLNAIRGLHSMQNGKDQKFADALFAFYSGYASHIFADGVFHPFIRDQVGDYAQNKNAHRALEMCLDVLLLDRLQGISLNRAAVQRALINIHQNPHKERVSSHFAKNIADAYGVNTTGAEILTWIDVLKKLIDTSSGNFPAWYQNIPSTETLSYRDPEALKNREGDLLTLTVPVDRSENFLKGTEKIHFINDCIPQFNKKFGRFIKQCYSYIYGKEESRPEPDIPSIDLDTGRPLVMNEDARNGINLAHLPTLWS